MGSEYYDCKLIITCSDEELEYYSYRHKLAKSVFLDKLFKNYEPIVEKNEFNFFLIYKFNNNFPCKINQKILDWLHNDNQGLSILMNDECIDCLIFYNILCVGMCECIMNYYHKFDITIQNKIKKYFNDNENSIDTEVMKRYKNISEIDDRQ